MEINKEKLVELIESCDFLGREMVTHWKKNIEKVPKRFYKLIFEKFYGLKKEIDNFYVEVELSRDEDGDYKAEISEKMSSSLKVLNSTQSSQTSKELLK